jgi:hypothetical protein
LNVVEPLVNDLGELRVLFRWLAKIVLVQKESKKPFSFFLVGAEEMEVPADGGRVLATATSSSSALAFSRSLSPPARTRQGTICLPCTSSLRR